MRWRIGYLPFLAPLPRRSLADRRALARSIPSHRDADRLTAAHLAPDARHERRASPLEKRLKESQTVKVTPDR